MQALTDDQLKWCLDQLGLTTEKFEQVRRARSVPEAEQLLLRLKAQAKRCYRQATRKLHPDLTGNDPKKTELFRILTEVMEKVDNLKIQPQPRPVRLRWAVRFR